MKKCLLVTLAVEVDAPKNMEAEDIARSLDIEVRGNADAKIKVIGDFDLDGADEVE